MTFKQNKKHEILLLLKKSYHITEGSAAYEMLSYKEVFTHNIYAIYNVSFGLNIYYYVLC